MAWETSDRKSRLPSNWLSLREEVFRLKGRACPVLEDGRPCDREATEVDHIIPSGSDDLANLRPICHRHHKSKSSSEGWHAMNRKKRAARARAEKKFGWAEKRPEPEAPFAHPWMK